MSLFKNLLPIVLENKKKLNQMAFDGCYYFFTVSCEHKIIKINQRLCIEHCYDTCRQYDSICYDTKDHCFWASAPYSYNRLFQLDCNMNEIDCILLCPCDEPLGVITGLSYNCCNDKVIVSFASVAVEVNKHCGKCTMLYHSYSGLITGILSICPGYLVTLIKDSKQFIYTLNHRGDILNCLELDCRYTIQSIIFNPCPSDCDTWFLDCLMIKNGCYPYLCKKSIQGCDLGYCPCCCNFDICHACCCEKPDPPCGNPCSDIMESIALIEASLSHILNAEGEKLQKVLATTDDINTILCVNKEVNKTIINVTHLEHVLYAKLQSLQDSNLCGNICQENGICDCIVDGGIL